MFSEYDFREHWFLLNNIPLYVNHKLVSESFSINLLQHCLRAACVQTLLEFFESHGAVLRVCLPVFGHRWNVHHLELFLSPRPLNQAPVVWGQ